MTTFRTAQVSDEEIAAFKRRRRLVDLADGVARAAHDMRQAEAERERAYAGPEIWTPEREAAHQRLAKAREAQEKARAALIAAAEEQP